MASVNKVILIGNLTRDVEMRYTTGGTAFANMGLAVSRQWFDKKTNQKQEETTFVDVTLWGRQAEIGSQYCQKGKQVYIEGRLKLDQWDDKSTGQKRSKLNVVCENLVLLGGGQGGGGQRRQQSNAEPQWKETGGDDSYIADQFGGTAVGEEDVPF